MTGESESNVARWGLVALLLSHLLLSLAFSLANPPFEATDEWEHYAFVRHLIEERRLPIQSIDEPRSQSHHAPLYYVVGALLTGWIEDSGEPPVQNPYWAYRAERVGNDNKRLYLHTGVGGEGCTGRCLATRLLRMFSILLGAASVYFIWKALREWVPSVPALALGGTGLVALSPMFVYMSGAINNDGMIVMWGAAAVWLSVRAIRRGLDLRQALMAGLVLGLALLSKASGLLLIPILILAYLLSAWCHGQWRQAIIGVALIVMVAAVLSGWWFLRNLQLYGELTGVRLSVDIWGARSGDETLLAAVSQLPYLWTTFWGRFGYGQIPLCSPIYFGLAVVVALALLGLVRLLVHPPTWLDKEAKLCMLLQATAIGLFLAGTVNYMYISPMGGNGRFLFPAMAAVAGLVFAGIIGVFPQRWSLGLSLVAPVSMAGLSVIAFLVFFMPAYTPPDLIGPDDIPAGVTTADVLFGDIQLIGFSLNQDRVRPGDEATVTLCWSSQVALTEDYAYFVHFLGPEESIIGARDTHPGLGLFPTTEWMPGDAFCDVLALQVEEWAPAPAVYAVEIGWYEPETGVRLAATDSAGSLLDPTLIGRIKTVPNEYLIPEVPNRVDADLGGQIILLGYDLGTRQAAPGQVMSVTLYWAIQTPIPNDYTVFLHLATPSDPPFAQADSQPVGGTYPTSFWDEGEVVIDERAITLPIDLSLGEYELLAGMYLLETGERLAVFDDQGARLDSDAVHLVTVDVVP